MGNDCPKILIVEDDPDIRELLEEVFRSEHYSVSVAKNGRIALEILRTSSDVFLVLLDLMMPVMSGTEFLKEISEDLKLKATPVIVMSAVADHMNTRGAVAYLKKPADLNEIVVLIKKYSTARVA